MYNKICPICRKMFAGRKNKVYCSRKCYEKFYWKNNTKPKGYKSIKKHRREKKKKLIEILGGKCEKCGYKKSLKALEFHHPDDNKEFTISKNLCLKFEILIEEVKRCVLLCANCHREEHDEYLGE